MLASLAELRLDPRGCRVMNPTSTGDTCTPPRHPAPRAERSVGDASAAPSPSRRCSSGFGRSQHILYGDSRTNRSRVKTGRTLGGYTIQSPNAFSTGRGPADEFTTRDARHVGRRGGGASARPRCGFAVAGSTRRHAPGDTRRGGRPGASPVRLRDPRPSGRTRSSRHPALTFPPLASTRRSSWARRRRSPPAAAPAPALPRSA